MTDPLSAEQRTRLEKIRPTESLKPRLAGKAIVEWLDFLALMERVKQLERLKATWAEDLAEEIVLQRAATKLAEHAESALTALRADHARLRESLRTYGEHRRQCAVRSTSREPFPTCNCGLAEALAGAPEETGAAKVEHVCGLEGYSGMIDPPCPACEANRPSSAEPTKEPR